MRYLKSVGAWIKRHYSRAGAFLGASLLAVSASAQEQTSNIDLSAASSAVTEMSSALKTFITDDLLDALLVIVGAGFVIFVFFLALKFIKRGSNKAA